MSEAALRTSVDNIVSNSPCKGMFSSSLWSSSIFPSSSFDSSSFDIANWIMVNKQNKMDTEKTTIIAMLSFDFSLYRKSLQVILTASWLNDVSVVFAEKQLYSTGYLSFW